MAERKTVAVCSLKGGVGRSLVSASLALAYARRGKRVLLLDLARHGHALDFLFGLQDRALFGFDDILGGRAADKTVVCPEGVPNLFLCSASERDAPLSQKELADLLERIGQTVSFDAAVLDLPCDAFKEGFYRDAADIHLVVSTANPASLMLAEKAAEALCGKDGSFLLLNCFDLSDPSSYQRGRLRAHEMIDLAGLPLIGIIPREYDLERRSEEGVLFRHEMQIDRPFDNVAARLEGEERLLFEGVRDGKSLRRSL